MWAISWAPSILFYMLWFKLIFACVLSDMSAECDFENPHMCGYTVSGAFWAKTDTDGEYRFIILFLSFVLGDPKGNEYTLRLGRQYCQKCLCFLMESGLPVKVKSPLWKQSLSFYSRSLLVLQTGNHFIYLTCKKKIKVMARKQVYQAYKRLFISLPYLYSILNKLIKVSVCLYAWKAALNTAQQ